MTQSRPLAARDRKPKMSYLVSEKNYEKVKKLLGLDKPQTFECGYPGLDGGDAALSSTEKIRHTNGCTGQMCHCDPVTFPTKEDRETWEVEDAKYQLLSSLNRLSSRIGRKQTEEFIQSEWKSK